MGMGNAFHGVGSGMGGWVFTDIAERVRQGHCEPGDRSSAADVVCFVCFLFDKDMHVCKSITNEVLSMLLDCSDVHGQHPVEDNRDTIVVMKDLAVPPTPLASNACV
jgi:hypothetical protein